MVTAPMGAIPGQTADNKNSPTPQLYKIFFIRS